MQNYFFLAFYCLPIKMSKLTTFLGAMNFAEEETLLLMSMSMFDTGRADIGRLDDREGIR